MPTSLKWRSAEQLFRKGRALFEENRYVQALIELRRAEEAFRKLDARGHPFGHALSNGVSGLANTLALSGRCYQELGNFRQAITCYETSLINEKFEKARPFRTFRTSLQEDLIACYDKDLTRTDEQTLKDLLGQDVAIDTSFCFPFSLGNNAFPLARLYELSPGRYPQYKDFYLRSKNVDSAIRRRTDKGLDKAQMKQAGIYIWVTMGVLWAAYSLIVSKALFLK